MRKITLLFGTTVALSAMLSSCAVQQISVNSEVQPFQNGGKVFGEKTKGKTINKSGDLFILGINVMNCNTQKMAKEIDANHYTVETKQNIVSYAISMFTNGLIDYKVVKVIKRDK